MRIGSKTEFYRLMERGCLGNTLRNWRSVADAYATVDVPFFGLREIGKAGGGLHVVVPRGCLPFEADRWRKNGRQYIIDEAAPDADVLLQGEVCRTFRGWEGLLGVRTGLRMRQSMQQGLLRPLQGLVVKALLDEFLDASSRDDLEILLELYPEATVEFAAYPYTLGKIPGRNSVIWEVRNY